MSPLAYTLLGVLYVKATYVPLSLLWACADPEDRATFEIFERTLKNLEDAGLIEQGPEPSYRLTRREQAVA